jgi:hypothetical protein
MARKVKNPAAGFKTSSTVQSATSAGSTGNVGNPPGAGAPSRGGALANDTPASQEILGGGGGPDSGADVSKPQ